MKKVLLATLALALVLWAAIPAVGQEFGDDDCSNVGVSDGGNGGTGGNGAGGAGGSGGAGGAGLGGSADGGAGGDIDQNSGDCDDNNSSDDDYYSDDDTSQEQEFEQNFDSGDLEQPVDISVPGDNNGVCTPVQQSGSTGNFGSEQGLEPLGSSSDDSDVDGNANGEFGPVMTTNCAPTVSQDATNQL